MNNTQQLTGRLRQEDLGEETAEGKASMMQAQF